ncbi:MAG: hypothetical protein HY647_10210 [Acidobacteria bacterium]|nr:hypothetical protein [Acidobacteriota bacterium]
MLRKEVRYIGLLALLLGCTPALSQDDADTADELARAAQSPFDIQRFVETHSKFEWEPLWKALNIEAWLPACSLNWAKHSCSSELITILNPPQILLLLHNDFSDFEVYLRFITEMQPSESAQWHFVGYYQPNVKYFRPEHRIVLFAGKPYLAVTGQAASGSGLSTEYEDWMDMTLSDFQPVFSYISKGHLSAFPSRRRFSREVWGSASALKEDPFESITVSYHIDFSIEADNGAMLRVGSREDTAIFTRTGSDKFMLDEKLSTATTEQVIELYEDLDSRISNEDFLRYIFPSLTRIALGPDTDERAWLEQFLTQCPDTTEKRQLIEMLQNPLKFSTQP